MQIQEVFAWWSVLNKFMFEMKKIWVKYYVGQSKGWAASWLEVGIQDAKSFQKITLFKNKNEDKASTRNSDRDRDRKTDAGTRTGVTGTAGSQGQIILGPFVATTTPASSAIPPCATATVGRTTPSAVRTTWPQSTSDTRKPSQDQSQSVSN